MNAPRRQGIVARDTKETQIMVILDIDGGELDLSESQKARTEQTNKHAFQSSKSQYIDIDTGIGFLDHMLHALSKHAGWSLYVRTMGDLHSRWKIRNPFCWTDLVPVMGLRVQSEKTFAVYG